VLRRALEAQDAGESWTDKERRVERILKVMRPLAALASLWCDTLHPKDICMIWKSVWHITSTELLTRIALAFFAALLGSLGVHFSSPVATTLAGFSVFLLIYRLRYKRL
jgi:hypothetical protein